MKKILIVLIIMMYASIAHASQPTGTFTNYACSYNAAPQGFILNLSRVRDLPSGAHHQILEVIPVTPQFYSKTQRGLGAYSPEVGSTGWVYMGKQSTVPGGGLGANGGYLRDPSGLLISGDVYKIIGVPLAPSFSSTSGGYIKELPQWDTLNCQSPNMIIDRLNQPSPQRPANYPTIPHISGASIAYNNSAGLPNSGTSTGGVPLPDMTHDDVETFLADNSMNTSLIIAMMHGISTNDWGDYLRLADTDFADVQGAIVDATTLRGQGLQDFIHDIQAKGYGDYFLAVYNDANINPDGFQYRPLPMLPAPQLEPLIMESEPMMILPAGWGQESYPKPNPPLGAAVFDTKKIYPSMLFDKPKSQAYYKGNSYHGGPADPHFKHLPLPSFCNPNNDNYIPAAFLNPAILEELRLDWRYLTQKNIASLQKIGFSFPEEYEHDFWQKCTLQENDCRSKLAKYNPKIKRIPVYDRPISQALNNQLMKRKSTASRPVAIDSSKKVKFKTESYYQNLITKSLVTMNPTYDAKACRPHYPQAQADMKLKQKVAQPKRMKNRGGRQ